MRQSKLYLYKAKKVKERDGKKKHLNIPYGPLSNKKKKTSQFKGENVNLYIEREQKISYLHFLVNKSKLK